MKAELERLVKISDNLDRAGKLEEADLLDGVIQKIAGDVIDLDQYREKIKPNEEIASIEDLSESEDESIDELEKLEAQNLLLESLTETNEKILMIRESFTLIESLLSELDVKIERIYGLADDESSNQPLIKEISNQALNDISLIKDQRGNIIKNFAQIEEIRLLVKNKI